MLQADNHKDVRVLIHEAVVSGILNKGGAKEHNVVKASPEGATQLVQQILRFARVGWPDN